MEVGSLGHFSSIHSIHAILSHLKRRSACMQYTALPLKKVASPASKLSLIATARMNGALPHYMLTSTLT